MQDFLLWPSIFNAMDNVITTRSEYFFHYWSSMTSLRSSFLLFSVNFFFHKNQKCFWLEQIQKIDPIFTKYYKVYAPQTRFCLNHPYAEQQFESKLYHWLFGEWPEAALTIAWLVNQWIENHSFRPRKQVLQLCLIKAVNLKTGGLSPT